MGNSRNEAASMTTGVLLGRLAVVAAVCLALRAVTRAVPQAAPPPESLVQAVLSLELPGLTPELPELEPLLRLELPGSLPAPPEAPSEEPAPLPAAEEPQVTAPVFVPREPPPVQEPPDTPEPVSTEALLSAISIQNRTDRAVDVAALLEDPLPFEVEGAAVLILHTHGSEAFTPDGADEYEATDPYRTVDDNYNVVRLGDELAALLEERGVTVFHDRSLYDYPSYSGSYNRALEAIRAALAEHPDIRVVIDLHRDALIDSDGRVYKTVADLEDGPSAQVMLIAGTDYSGLSHPDWEKNLTFALKLQAEMMTRYPTLARPLYLTQYRYNQHATTGSLIVEVGSNGNTLQEALTAVRHFGDCLASVLEP